MGLIIKGISKALTLGRSYSCKPKITFSDVSLLKQMSVRSFFGNMILYGRVEQWHFNGGDMILYHVKPNGKIVVFVGLDTDKTYQEILSTVIEELAQRCFKNGWFYNFDN